MLLLSVRHDALGYVVDDFLYACHRFKFWHQIDPWREAACVAWRCHEITKAMPIVSFVLKGHKSSVNCLDFQESLLLSGSDDQTARLWDVRTSKTCLCLRTTGEVTSVAFAGPHSKEDTVNVSGLPFAKNTSV
jgi:WD40 repeat protein